MSHFVPEIGNRVEIDSIGWGTIIKHARLGAIVRLEDYGQIEITVYPRQIISVDKGDEKPKSPSQSADADHREHSPSPAPRIKDNNYYYAKSLEALRFGLVPETHIEELTVGLEPLRDWVLSCFPQARGGTPHVFEINGPFGTGKSHTMAVVRHLAEKNGYLTARAEVDAQNVSITDPAKLLCSLWGTLRGHQFESVKPLLDLYTDAMDRGHSVFPGAKGDLDNIRCNYETIVYLKRLGALDDYCYDIESLLSSDEAITARQLTDKISRGSSVSRSMINFRDVVGRAVAGRPAGFVESLAGHALMSKFAGFKGIVITIDEFEVETALSNTRMRNERSNILLEVLSQYINGHTHMPKAPFTIFIASVGEEGHLRDALIDKIVGGAGESTYQLKSFTSLDRLLLAEKIHGLYCRRYSKRLPFRGEFAKGVEQIQMKRGYDESGLTRAFIKLFVGMMDLNYGPPGVKH